MLMSLSCCRRWRPVKLRVSAAAMARARRGMTRTNGPSPRQCGRPAPTWTRLNKYLQLLRVLSGEHVPSAHVATHSPTECCTWSCLVSTDCHCWAAGLLTAEHGSGSCAVSSSSSSSPWPLQSAISGPNEGHCRGRPSLLLIIHCTPWLFIYRLFCAGWPDGPGAHQLNQLNSYQREIGKKRINTEQTWRGFTLTLTYTQHHIAAHSRLQHCRYCSVSRDLGMMTIWCRAAQVSRHNAAADREVLDICL